MEFGQDNHDSHSQGAGDWSNIDLAYHGAANDGLLAKQTHGVSDGRSAAGLSSPSVETQLSYNIWVIA